MGYKLWAFSFSFYGYVTMLNKWARKILQRTVDDRQCFRKNITAVMLFSQALL